MRGTLYNCIVWSNRAASDANFWGGTYTYCCTTPNPGGIGNMTNDPRFVNAAGGIITCNRTRLASTRERTRTG